MPESTNVTLGYSPCRWNTGSMAKRGEFFAGGKSFLRQFLFKVPNLGLKPPPL